jgi:3-oxoadipate enol-lactonase
MPFITSEGTNLFVDIAGAGTPVLFVHGFGMDHRQWDPQWRALAPHAQTLRMDLRAHGRSATSAKGYTYRAMARDLERVLYQVGVDRLNPGFIVAHALAADAALQVALAEPRALRGVVVAAPAVHGQTWSDEWRALWNGMRDDARSGRPAAALERFRGDALFDGVRLAGQTWESIQAMHKACSAAHLTAGERDTGPTTLERLPECGVPLLVISGCRDRVDFQQAARAIAGRAPAAELHELDCGHFPNLERPDEFNALVRKFMARGAS